MAWQREVPKGQLAVMSPVVSLARETKGNGKRIVLAAVAVLTLAGAANSGSPLVVFAGGAVLGLIVLLLWRADEVPVLLIPALYQWAEVVVKPVITATSGATIDSLADFQAPLESAALFALAGVAAFAIGLRLGSGKPRRNALGDLRIEAATRWQLPLLLKLSVGLVLVGHALAGLAYAAGPARQIVLALSSVQLGGLFMLAFWSLSNRAGYAYLAVVVSFEVVIGMTGFFAGFRASLLVLCLAAVAARPALGVRNFLVVTLAGFVTLGVAVYWSAIKPDYRDFVNRGSGAQVVAEPFSNRLGYLFDAARGFDQAQFADGFDRLVKRLSYIDFLAATLNHVPSVVPHEDGALVGAAMAHILTPRILFPNKPALPNDSDVTEHYTGLPVGGNINTSISIGYLGELYVDFGTRGGSALCSCVGNDIRTWLSTAEELDEKSAARDVWHFRDVDDAFGIV